MGRHNNTILILGSLRPFYAVTTGKETFPPCFADVKINRMAEGGGITGLMALFSDTDSLEVPDFQRNYSWGEEQIDEFHKDVVFATRKNLDHFMGSVILMKSPSEEKSKTFQVNS